MIIWKDRWAALAAGAVLALACAACGDDPLDDISITAVELRTAPRLEFLRARVGMRFLEVRMEFENGKDEPVAVKQLDFALRDTRGTLHPFSAQVLDMGQPRGFPTVHVQPGQRLAGSVVFQIPEESAPAELIYRQELGGGLSVSLKTGR